MIVPAGKRLRRVGAWEPLPDDEPQALALGRLSERLVEFCRALGWRATDARHLAMDVVLVTTSTGPTLIGEVRVLDLRNRNPMPRIRLFDWLPG